MRARQLVVAITLAAIAQVAPALDSPARAGEPAPWDGPRVASLAKQLEDRTGALYDAVWKQPRPVLDLQRKDYFRLKREVRHLKHEARDFAGDVAQGAGAEETRPGYEALLSSARWTRQASRSVFTAKDVNDRAAEVGELLRQIAPYYGAEAPASDR